MAWNYRIMRHVEGDEISYAVHEVFYDKDGAVVRWTDQPAGIVSDSRDEVVLVLANMADAYGQPVLDGKTGLEVEPAKVMSDNLASSLKQARDVFDLRGEIG